MLSFQDVNYLGQAIDTSWGRTSTPQDASYSVKISLLGDDKILVKYVGITNFNSQLSLTQEKKKYSTESQRVITAVLKNVSKNFSQLAGKKLTLSQDSTSESVEVVNLAVHNPNRTAYYRRNSVYSVS